VPSALSGTASMQNRHVMVGAVLAAVLADHRQPVRLGLP
jgi:hypothetical protein